MASHALETFLTTYDPSILINEDDVESKFVVPFFKALDYPESHRRGKYPVEIYSGQKGRKHEADQVYFASANRDQQIVGMALVIVEAKRPDEPHLDKAIEQVQSYGEKLRPLLLVITNGLQLRVLRRKRFNRDEPIFDGSIGILHNPERARALVEVMSFTAVLAQHEQLIDEPSHERFVMLEHALRAYPDIQAILAQGDFSASEEHAEQSFRVTRSKVQIEGTLPLCLSGGSCVITFSHILRRGLRIHLDHAGILRALMVGIGSNPNWDTRHFIERDTEETYLVRLGGIETQLSFDEVRDLCTCIDRFATAYRDILMQTEDTLEAWTFPMVQCNSYPAWYLTSIPTAFWKQVQLFTEEHDIRYGFYDDEWNRFDFWALGFRIVYEDGDHVWLSTSSKLSFLLYTEQEMKHFIYVLPDGSPLPDINVQAIDWQQNTGLNGQWSVQQTYEWLVGKLLPEVERRCQRFPRSIPAHMLFHSPYAPTKRILCYTLNYDKR